MLGSRVDNLRLVGRYRQGKRNRTDGDRITSDNIENSPNISSEIVVKNERRWN